MTAQRDDCTAATLGVLRMVSARHGAVVAEFHGWVIESGKSGGEQRIYEDMNDVALSRALLKVLRVCIRLA